MMRLREHEVVLRGPRVTLRPMTELDWPHLLKWNNDPDVLRTAEGDEVEGYSLEQVQTIYRSVSETAYCFMIEVDGGPVGECWLQQMNLDRILRACPDQDVRRIDLVIGEADYRGQGLGTEVIMLLTRFAFEQEEVNLVFGCDIGEDNPASLGAFQRAGYVVHNRVEQAPGAKARFRHDLKIQKPAS